MKILSFIPARGGSKGIKNKNLIPFNGKPLIFSTITTSKKLKNVTSFVSTDSKKILNYSKLNGIKYDYLRPKKLATDQSEVINSIFHALSWFKEKNVFFDAVMMLQPTTPVRKLSEIKKIINIFKKRKIDSIISVTKMKEHPYECIKYKGNSWDFIEKKKIRAKRRQDYPQNFYFIDGSVYLAKVSFLKKNKTFVLKNKTKLFISSQFPGIDIDNYVDLKISELFIKKNKNN